jgi:hypothetical protein
LPHQEEVALARKLIDPYAELALKHGGAPDKVRILEVLARIEPERVLDVIQQKKVFDNAYFNGMVGLSLAAGVMEESVDEALAVLEGLENPGARADGLINASKKLGVQNRSRALEVLDRALLSARAAKEPDGIKLLFMGQVAEQFLDLGEAERGRALLREGEALAKQLPKAGWVGYARGAFAEELVQIDFDAALDLVKDLANAREFDRHHGNIAHELAGRDPPRSERVLAMVKEKNQRDYYAVRVVYRMAPLDLARARRLAESISDEGLKGYALGMMARRLAEAGKDSAKELLESAYDMLERASRASQEKSNSIYDITSIAGVLLPVAERVDPRLVDEYFWRSLAMRQPTPWETYPGRRQSQSRRQADSDSLLAVVLARYDRTIARLIVEPLVPDKGTVADFVTTRGELYVAAAVINPRWAAAIVEALPDDPDLKTVNTKNSARLAVANVLGRVGEQRFRHLQHSFLYLWVPDTEDIDPDR